MSFPELSPHAEPHFVGVYTHAYFVEDSLDVFKHAKLYRHSSHLFKIYHNKASDFLWDVLGELVTFCVMCWERLQSVKLCLHFFHKMSQKDERWSQEGLHAVQIRKEETPIVHKKGIDRVV